MAQALTLGEATGVVQIYLDFGSELMAQIPVPGFKGRLGTQWLPLSRPQRHGLLALKTRTKTVAMSTHAKCPTADW